MNSLEMYTAMAAAKDRHGRYRQQAETHRMLKQAKGRSLRQQLAQTLRTFADRLAPEPAHNRTRQNA